MSNVKKTALSLGFAAAAVAVQAWPAPVQAWPTWRIATNGLSDNGIVLNGMIDGAEENGILNSASVSGTDGVGSGRGLEIQDVELPQAVVEYCKEE